MSLSPPPPPPPGGLLLTVLGPRFWCGSYSKLFGVGVSCRNLYSIVGCLCVSCGGYVASVGEERELVCLLSFTCNCVVSVRGIPLPQGAWDGLRYFIVALPGPSIQLFWKKQQHNPATGLAEQLHV